MAKQKLVENFSKDWQEPLQLKKLTSLKESEHLIEADGKAYKAFSGYEVPIWRLGKKNLNGRTYLEALGRHVVKVCENLVTANLADHPSEDGSVKDIIAISKNPHIREGILWVNSYFVDKAFEEKVEKMIELGYGFGVSSSSFGELNEATGDVLEEGFEIDRFWDGVLSPSYSVFITKESRNESIDLKESILEENATNKGSDKKETIFMSDTTKKTLEEKNFHVGVMNLQEKAESKTELKDKIKAYEAILNYCEGVEYPETEKYLKESREQLSKLSEEVQVLVEKGKKLSEVEEAKAETEKEKDELEKDKEEKEKELEEATKKFTELETKYTLATKMLDDFKQRESTLQEMYEIATAERNGMIEAEDFAKLHHESTKQKQIIAKLKEENDNLDKENDELANENDELEKEMKEVAKKYSSLRKRFYEDENPGEPDESIPEDQYNFGDQSHFKGYSRGPKDRVDYKESKKESTKDYDLTEATDIKEYYSELLESNPNVRFIGKQILGCKTLIEAQKTYMNLESLIDKKVSPFKKKQLVKEAHQKTDSLKPISTEMPSGNLVRHGWL